MEDKHVFLFAILGLVTIGGIFATTVLMKTSDNAITGEIIGSSFFKNSCSHMEVLRVTVSDGPQGMGPLSPSIEEVNVMLMDPTSGKVIRQQITDQTGAFFPIEVNKIFYVTTPGEVYGFYRQLNQEGIPTFMIQKRDGIYQLCNLADNTCGATLRIGLYSLR